MQASPARIRTGCPEAFGRQILAKEIGSTPTQQAPHDPDQRDHRHVRRVQVPSPTHDPSVFAPDRSDRSPASSTFQLVEQVGTGCGDDVAAPAPAQGLHINHRRHLQQGDLCRLGLAVGIVSAQPCDLTAGVVLRAFRRPSVGTCRGNLWPWRAGRQTEQAVVCCTYARCSVPARFR